MSALYNNPPFYFCTYRSQKTTEKLCPSNVGESEPNTNKTMTQAQLASLHARLTSNQTESTASIAAEAALQNVTLEEVVNCEIVKTDSTSYVNTPQVIVEPPKKAKVYKGTQYKMTKKELHSWASRFRFR